METEGGSSRTRPRDFELLENVPVGVFVSEGADRIVYANAAHCRILGRTPSEILGRPVWEQCLAQELERVVGHYAAGPGRRKRARSSFLTVGECRVGTVLGLAQLSPLSSGPEPDLTLTTIFPVSVAALSQAIEVAEMPSPDGTRGDLEQLLAGVRYLTPRERHVLGRLIEGAGIVDIADELGLAVSTIRNHVHAIYRALRIRSRDELHALVFRELGRSYIK